MKIFTLSAFVGTPIVVVTVAVLILSSSPPTDQAFNEPPGRSVTAVDMVSQEASAGFTASSEVPTNKPLDPTIRAAQSLDGQPDRQAQNPHQIETFLTSPELQVLHSEILNRLSSPPEETPRASIPVASLNLDRSQQTQLYLEEQDEIIQINHLSIADLSDNPAVGSMLAGPTMTLGIQRGPDVLEIELQTY